MSAAPPMPPESMPSPQPGLSEAARIINTFIAPSKTFEDIKRKASWWVPFVLSCVFAIAFFVTIDKKVGFDQVSREMLSHNSQVQQQTPEQQERTIAITTAITKYLGYAAPVFILLYGLVIAAVLMATFNFALQAEVSFGRSLAIVFYAWLPAILSSILGIISLMIGNPDSFHMQNPVATNPAYFLDQATTSKFLYTFLTSFDVISLWTVVLLGIGFTVNSKKKLSTGTAIMVVAVWFFLVKLVGASFAQLRG
ncbi:MAG TPA: YIP1 family protein [Candidatus Angelobacter sp.]|nr:YIP1 family protein [Candidatus Angelobacter sp.]